MAIFFKPTVKKSASGSVQHFAASTQRQKITLDQVSKRIASRSTLTEADTVAVLHSLLEIIPEYLLEGNTVFLDNFGIFSTHIKSSGADTPEEVTANNIEGLKVSFRPSVKFKDRMKKAVFKKVKP